MNEDFPFSNDTVTNTYSNRLRVAMSLQQPTGLWTNGFKYDAASRLTNVTSQAGSFGYLYDASRHQLPSRVALPNSAWITNTYDSVARLLSTTLKNSSGTTLNSHSYVYNVGNQRTNQTFADASTVNYTYDNIGQLVVADSSINSEDRGYLYDAAWNLSKRTNNGSVSTFNVDIRDQLTSAGGSTCVYDIRGNLTNYAGYHSYGYDDENRLIQASDETYHSYRIQFVYDGLGRLREQLQYKWTNSFWSNTNTVQYVYDGMRVIQERNGGTPVVSYTRGIDLSGTMEGAGGIGGLLARSAGYSAGNWTSHTYYHADSNGNVTYLIDGSQAMAASYKYDPFGNTISSSGSLATANTYQFSSKPNIANAGYYYGYRFYDPNLQRWLNRDPLEEIGGINLYSHTLNNPVGFVDPWGLDLPGLLPGNPNGLGSGIGSVSNGTTNTYAGSGSVGQHGPLVPVRIPPGHSGGGATGTNDMDFIYPTSTCPINGLTNGAFKVGSNESRLKPNPIPGMPNNANLSNFRGYWPPAQSTNLPGYPK